MSISDTSPDLGGQNVLTEIGIRHRRRTTRTESEFSVAVYTRRIYTDIYRVGQKTGLFFRLDNFVVVSPRKACSMLKFSQFYREKRYKTRISMSLNILCQICSNHHNS